MVETEIQKILHVRWEIVIRSDFSLILILTFPFRNCSLERDFRINTQTTLMQNVACCAEQVICLGLSDPCIQLVCVDENSREEQMLWLSIHCLSIFTLLISCQFKYSEKVMLNDPLPSHKGKKNLRDIFLFSAACRRLINIHWTLKSPWGNFHFS